MYTFTKLHEKRIPNIRSLLRPEVKYISSFFARMTGAGGAFGHVCVAFLFTHSPLRVELLTCKIMKQINGVVCQLAARRCRRGVIYD